MADSSQIPDTITTDDDDSILMTPDMSDYQLLHTPQPFIHAHDEQNDTDNNHDNTLHTDTVTPTTTTSADNTPTSSLQPPACTPHIACRPMPFKRPYPHKIHKIVNKLHDRLSSNTDTNFTNSITNPIIIAQNQPMPLRYKVHFTTNLLDSGLPRTLFSTTYLLSPGYHTKNDTYLRIIRDTKSRISRMEPYATLKKNNIQFEFTALISYNSPALSPFQVPNGTSVQVPYNSQHMCSYLPIPITTINGSFHMNYFILNLTFRITNYSESRIDAFTQMSDLYLQNRFLDSIHTNLNQWHHIYNLDRKRGIELNASHIPYPLVTDQCPPPLMSLQFPHISTVPPTFTITPLQQPNTHRDSIPTSLPIPASARLGPPLPVPAPAFSRLGPPVTQIHHNM